MVTSCQCGAALSALAWQCRLARDEIEFPALSHSVTAKFTTPLFHVAHWLVVVASPTNTWNLVRPVMSLAASVGESYVGAVCHARDHRADRVPVATTVLCVHCVGLTADSIAPPSSHTSSR